MKRIIYLSILAVLLAFFITLVFSIVSARRAAGAEADPVGVVIGETMTVTQPQGTTSIYEATYAIHIYYPCCGRVATKKLWIRAEWWEAEKLVRILNASSPNIIYAGPKSYLFSWERLGQDVFSTGWGSSWIKYSVSRLWCKLFNCYDYKYELDCQVFGDQTGKFVCHWEKW